MPQAKQQIRLGLGFSNNLRCRLPGFLHKLLAACTPSLRSVLLGLLDYLGRLFFDSLSESLSLLPGLEQLAGSHGFRMADLIQGFQPGEGDTCFLSITHDWRLFLSGIVRRGCPGRARLPDTNKRFADHTSHKTSHSENIELPNKRMNPDDPMAGSKPNRPTPKHPKLT